MSTSPQTVCTMRAIYIHKREDGKKAHRIQYVLEENTWRRVVPVLFLFKPGAEERTPAHNLTIHLTSFQINRV